MVIGSPATVVSGNRTVRLITVWNVAAAALVWFWWPVGITMSWMGVLAKVPPPETPRYLSEAPIIEGEG